MDVSVNTSTGSQIVEPPRGSLTILITAPFLKRTVLLLPSVEIALMDAFSTNAINLGSLISDTGTTVQSYILLSI